MYSLSPNNNVARLQFALTENTQEAISLEVTSILLEFNELRTLAKLMRPEYKGQKGEQQILTLMWIMNISGMKFDLKHFDPISF